MRPQGFLLAPILRASSSAGLTQGDWSTSPRTPWVPLKRTVSSTTSPTLSKRTTVSPHDRHARHALPSVAERCPVAAVHGGNRGGYQLVPKHPRTNCGADCGHPCATDHGENCGSGADHTTGARAESYGGADRGLRGQLWRVIQLIPQEGVSERIFEQLVEVPVPQIEEQIVEVVKIIHRSGFSDELRELENTERDSIRILQHTVEQVLDVLVLHDEIV